MRLAEELSRILGERGDVSRRVYMGRVGHGATPSSRSIRPSLEKLLVNKGA